MTELNHKNGNGTANANGNGNGKVNLEDTVRNISNGKNEKKGIRKVTRRLLNILPITREIIQDYEIRVDSLSKIALHDTLDEIRPENPSPEAHLKCIAKRLYALNKPSTPKSKNSSKVLLLEDDKEKEGRIKVKTAIGANYPQGLPYEMINYNGYLDPQSGIVSSIVGTKGIPLEVVVNDGEVSLNKIQFVDGKIIRSPYDNFYKSIMKNFYGYYSQKENYRKYETVFFEENEEEDGKDNNKDKIWGILAIKEEYEKSAPEIKNNGIKGKIKQFFGNIRFLDNFLNDLGNKTKEAEESQRNWDLKITRTENEKGKWAAELKTSVLLKENKEQAVTDKLTGLHNLRHYETESISHMDTALKLWYEESEIMIDFDHFKRYNDTYGHDTGDKVLKKATKIIQDSCYPTDMVIRKGGEEILVYMPATKGLDALKVAEKIRKNFEDAIFEIGGVKEKLTVSCGVADSRLTLDYARKKVKDKVFMMEEYDLWKQYNQFLERHDAHKVIVKDKDNIVDEHTKMKVRREYLEPGNIAIFVGALDKIADNSLYRAKEDGRNRCYLFDIKKDYYSQKKKEIVKKLIYGLQNYSTKK